MRKKLLLGLEISTISYHNFIEDLLVLARSKKGHYACFANVHMLVEAYFDPGFANVVNNAAMIAPDGKALCWALQMLHGLKQDRVAGMDILPDMLQKSKESKLSVFFYGGSEKTLDLTKEFIEMNYPGLKMAGFISPPFRPLTIQEKALHLHQINASGADLIFVCLGCPKQEKWMAAQAGNVKGLMLGIGGALAVLIGAKRRAPKFLQDTGMEWLFRLMQEPRRLFRRYASTNSIFLYLVCKELIRTRFVAKRSDSPLL